MGGGKDDRQHQHVLVALPIAEPVELLLNLRKRFPDYKISWRHVKEDMPDELWKDVTVLFTLNTLPSKLGMVPNLELLQMYSAGVNSIQQHPLYTSSKIPICTTSGIHGPTIAEWVVMTTLVGGHFYNILHEWQQAQSWGPPAQSGRFDGLRQVRDLVGQRIGILGYGSIGRQVGRVAKAMGMDVVAYTAGARETPESKRDPGYIVPGTGDPEGTIPVEWFSGTRKEDLHAFLSADIDVLVISVPLTAQTQYLLGATEFDLLSHRNAFIVNISRGKILVQDALIAALRTFADEGYRGNTARPGLRGAALDVTDPEPLPQGHPLFTTPNCIVTPHISGMSVEYSSRAFDVLRLNLERFREGKKLINAVDRKKGY